MELEINECREEGGTSCSSWFLTTRPRRVWSVIDPAAVIAGRCLTSNGLRLYLTVLVFIENYNNSFYVY